MSCSYRTIGKRMAAIVGMPAEEVHHIVDIGRKMRDTAPPCTDSLVWEACRVRFGTTESCDSTDALIQAIRSGLAQRCHQQPDHPVAGRMRACAAILGFPEDKLDAPPERDIIETVRAQFVRPRMPAPPLQGPIPVPPRDARAAAGLMYLDNGLPIPQKWKEHVKAYGDRETAVVWIVNGETDEILMDMCDSNLSDEQITAILKAGIVPPRMIPTIGERVWSWKVNIPWHLVPMWVWDHIKDEQQARIGRACTAASWLIENPHAAAREVHLAAIAQEPAEAARVMIERADLRDNERLIDAVATRADLAAWVMGSTNWRNEQLITTITGNPACAAEVLIARPDLRTDERLIAAVADSPRWATAVVCEAQHRDPRLIHAIARDPMRAAKAAIEAGIRDDVIMESIARSHEATIEVVALTDTEDERLIQIVASDPHAIRRVMKRRPKVRAAIAAAVRARSASKPRNQATHRDNPPDAGETGSQQMPQ